MPQNQIWRLLSGHEPRIGWLEGRQQWGGSSEFACPSVQFGLFNKASLRSMTHGGWVERGRTQTNKTPCMSWQVMILCFCLGGLLHTESETLSITQETIKAGGAIVIYTTLILSSIVMIWILTRDTSRTLGSTQVMQMLNLSGAEMTLGPLEVEMNSVLLWKFTSSASSKEVSRYIGNQPNDFQPAFSCSPQAHMPPYTVSTPTVV